MIRYKNKQTRKTYMVHITGCDDIVGPFTEIYAHREANWINKAFVKDLAKNNTDAVICVATVIELEVV